MKNIILIFAAFCYFTNTNAQTLYNYKTKTVANAKERSIMLDIFRNQLYKEYQQNFLFEVEIFNVSNDYAWFKANVKRKDGKEIALKNSDYDCCHVEALFKKNNGNWTIVESGSFSTDVWYDRIWERVKAPIEIFGDDYHK